MSKTKAKFKNVATYERDLAVSHEAIDPSSETVQNEAYTISELVARHRALNDPGIDRPVVYLDTEDFDAIDVAQLRQLDLFDQEQYLGKIREQAAAAVELVKAARKAAEERTADDDNEPTERNERSVETKPEASTSE